MHDSSAPIGSERAHPLEASEPDPGEPTNSAQNRRTDGMARSDALARNPRGNLPTRRRNDVSRGRGPLVSSGRCSSVAVRSRALRRASLVPRLSKPTRPSEGEGVADIPSLLELRGLDEEALHLTSNGIQFKGASREAHAIVELAKLQLQ